MAIRFRCNRCNRPFSVRDEMAGKQAQCRQCGHKMRVPAVATPPPALTPPRPQPVVVPAIDSGPEIDAYGFDELDDEAMVDLDPVGSPIRSSGGRWPTSPTGGVGSVRRAAVIVLLAVILLSVIGGILKHLQHAG